jgi:hypothetical protein
MEDVMATAVRPQFDIAQFFHHLAHTEHGTLVLDFESTVARLHAVPEPRFPYPRITELLECIMATGRTRVVVASTRPVAELGSALVWPEAEVWASDGMERVLATTPQHRARVPLCIRPRAEFGLRRSLIDELCDRGPVAYVMGDPRTIPATTAGFAVVPELHLDRVHKSLAAPESFLQFLVEWLRACAGEIC